MKVLQLLLQYNKNIEHLGYKVRLQITLKIKDNDVNKEDNVDNNVGV